MGSVLATLNHHQRCRLATTHILLDCQHGRMERMAAIPRIRVHQSRSTIVHCEWTCTGYVVDAYLLHSRKKGGSRVVQPAKPTSDDCFKVDPFFNSLIKCPSNACYTLDNSNNENMRRDNSTSTRVKIIKQHVEKWCAHTRAGETIVCHLWKCANPIGKYIHTNQPVIKTDR